MDKTVKKLLAELRTRPDVRVEYGGKHIKCFGPGGMVAIPGDLSQHRAVLNIRAQLRRIGAI